MKIPRTSARDQGYAGPAERHMVNLREGHRREAETEKEKWDRIDAEREQRLIQNELDDMEIERRQFRQMEDSYKEKLKKADDIIKEKEASMRTLEETMDRMQEELTLSRRSGQEAVAGPSTSRPISGRVLLNLNREWRKRWNHLVDKWTEARRRGEEPEPMFIETRPEQERTESKWRIKEKARHSKYICGRNRADPDHHHSPEDRRSTTPSLSHGYHPLPGGD